MNENYDKYILAGRLINDISLEDLSNIYKRKVLDLISLLQFKTIVFDFDGTLTEFKYDNNRLLPCKDNELYEYSKNNNIYEDATILKRMKYILNELDTNNVYVLTVTVDTLRNKKLNFITKNFDINPNHIIQVNDSNEKMNVLEELHKKTKKNIIFLEDTAKTLLNAEEKFNFVKGYHISSLIP